MSSFDRTVTRGFFRTLFDFDFRSFVTLKFIKFIYAIVVIGIGVGALVLVVALFTRGLAYGVLGIVLAPIGALVFLIVTRIQLEVVAVLFRIGENTSVLVAAARPPFAPGRPAPGGPPEPWGGSGSDAERAAEGGRER